MSNLAVVFLLVFLLIYAVPVVVLRAERSARVQDYVVAAGPTPPGVLQNASIASALRLALFAPAFVWGARGELLSAVLFAAAAGFGIFLLYVLRRPLREFLQAALGRDQSITVHAFIADVSRGDRRVRLLAAGLSVVAVSGLLVAEAVGLTLLLKPMQPGSDWWAYLLVGAMLAAVPLYAAPSGHAAVMHAAQGQLGMAYLGLFGATAFLLYLLLAAFPPMPPFGSLALVGVAVISVVMVVYRRSRYVDTSPIRVGGVPANEDARAVEPRSARMLRRFNKALNPLLSVLLVTVAVFAVMGLLPFGLDKVMQDAVATWQQPTALSGIEPATLVLVPLCYPLVDVANWQQLAAFEKGAPSGYDRTAELRRFIRTYALDTALVLLFVVAVSAVGKIATAAPVGADVVQAFIARLAFQQNFIAAGALSFLLIGVIVVAFSTMIALFSAGLCTLHADLLPALRQRPAPDPTATTREQAGLGTIAPPRLISVALGLFLAIIIVFALAETMLSDRAMGASYRAILIALVCCQLSLVPLVLGSIIARWRGGAALVRPHWALLILATSAAIGVGAVAIHLASGSEAWLWAAVPLCLGSGILLLALARLWPAKAITRV